MEVEGYLARIGGPTVGEPDADELAALQRAHLLTVPFENLDIHLGRPIELDVEAFYEKVVQRCRGGFCYELNGLFAWLLEALGYEVATAAARVVGPDGKLGPPFDHMVLLVELDRTWLADVGFGRLATEPLVLREGPQGVAGGRFRLRREGAHWHLDEAGDEGWNEQYRFEPRDHRLEDFSETCRYHQTSPESLFTTKPLCTLPLQDGRITLSGSRFIETRGDERTERTVTPDEAEALLRDRFGMGAGARWPRDETG